MKNIFKILLLAITFSSLSTNNLLSNTINGIELKSIVNAWLEEKNQPPNVKILDKLKYPSCEKSKMIINGDIDQVKENNGLKDFIQKLNLKYPSELEKYNNSISFINLDNNDIQRHQIIKKVIKCVMLHKVNFDPFKIPTSIGVSKKDNFLINNIIKIEVKNA